MFSNIHNWITEGSRYVAYLHLNVSQLHSIPLVPLLKYLTWSFPVKSEKGQWKDFSTEENDTLFEIQE